MKAIGAVARILTVGVLAGFTGWVAAQQAYPNKPIRLIVPFTPAGSTTVSARLIAQKLTESWGQPVIVDNRPGANTIIGSEALVKSQPDGYTIMEVTPFLVANPHLFPNLSYDAIKDFAPVGTILVSEYLLVLHPSLPANNLQEFIALVKSRPGQLNYASTGIAGGGHIASEMLNIMAGLKIQHIPYKGAGPAVTDLLGGQVQIFFTPPSNVVPYVKTGKLKAIAISGETRFAALPQVPTFTEAGLQNFDVKAWYGVLAPAGTPKEIIGKLSTELARILALPDVKEKLLGLGLEPFFSTPDQFAALIRADLSRYGKIIKTANIKADQ